MSLIRAWVGTPVRSPAMNGWTDGQLVTDTGRMVQRRIVGAVLRRTRSPNLPCARTRSPQGPAVR